ncbi:MAG: GGDEF domain-containing protein [Hydrogenophaga sp.]|nr:GGDEF domain-containing protein [Hydrogenophaga sp.]
MEEILRDPWKRVPSHLKPDLHAYLLARHSRFLLLVNLMGQMAFLVYGWADQLIIPDQTALSWMLRTGYVVFLATATYLIFVRWHNILFMDSSLPVSIIGAAAIWFWLLERSVDPHTAMYQYASLIFIVLANLGVQVSFVVALASSILISLVIAIGVVNVTNANPDEMMIFALVYFPVLFFSLFISWSNFVARRKEFAQEMLNRIAKRSLQNSNRALDELAHTDMLTGLDNRRQFEKMVHHELARVARTPQPVCLMLFDIDHFKHINDAEGHEVGDAALKAVADAARQQIRQHDVIARYGGDEFSVLLTNTALPDAMVVAERIRAAVEASHIDLPSGGTIHCTTSIGIVQMGPAALRLEELMSAADKALYVSKIKGRNQVSAHDSTSLSDLRCPLLSSVQHCNNQAVES